MLNIVIWIICWLMLLVALLQIIGGVGLSDEGLLAPIAYHSAPARRLYCLVSAISLALVAGRVFGWW